MNEFFEQLILEVVDHLRLTESEATLPRVYNTAVEASTEARASMSTYDMHTAVRRLVAAKKLSIERDADGDKLRILIELPMCEETKQLVRHLGKNKKEPPSAEV